MEMDPSVTFSGERKITTAELRSPGPLKAREGPADHRSFRGEPLKPNGKI